MDRGIKLQKELAMGMKSAQREATGTPPGGNKKVVKNMKAGGCACGGSVKKGKK